MFTPKLFNTLKTYNRQQFGKDLMAGLIVGIVALPLAIAFAIASGVSPEKGLYTAIIAGFIISALGGSRVQIGGPTGAFIVIVYGIVQTYGVNGLIIATFGAGLPVWFVNYHTYTKGMFTIISEILIFLLAAYASFQNTAKNKAVFLIVAAGFILAIALKIVIDIFINPTDHNLWPFEMVLYMIAAVIFSGAGVGLGWGLKKLLNNGEKHD